MKITINEPCHENWDAMTPNKQGAFCQSCVKDVVDFSKMSVGQIKDFFSKPQSEKVCGRFEEKQLQELSFDDFFAKFTYWNFSKKFAVIFFMAFGFWVFSNANAVAQNSHMLKGEVAYVAPKPVQKDTTKKRLSATSTPTLTPVQKDKHPIMGKVKCTNPIPVKKETENEPKMLMGDVMIPEEKQAISVIKINTDTTRKDSISNIEPVVKEQVIMGMVMMPVRRTEEITHMPPVIKVDSIVVSEKISGIENEKPIAIYPNPGNGIFVIETTQAHSINIFDESGKLVLTQNINGTSTIDASALMPGIYTVDISNEKATIRKKIILVK